MDQLQSTGQEKAASSPRNRSPIVLGQPARSQVNRLFRKHTCALPNCLIAFQPNERWPGLCMDQCHPQVSKGPLSLETLVSVRASSLFVPSTPFPHSLPDDGFQV